MTKQKHEEEEDDQNANTRETVKQTFFYDLSSFGQLGINICQVWKIHGDL